MIPIQVTMQDNTLVLYANNVSPASKRDITALCANGIFA